MDNWRNTILKHFEKGISRLTLVSDPDGLLIEEGILAAIKERGFDLILFEDSIAFRYAYESKYRAVWDEGKNTDLVVVLRSEQDIDSLPYDLLHAGRRMEFSLHRLFPNLSYPVLGSLDGAHLDALYDAYQHQHDSVLGEKATKDFVLMHCFRIVPSLISTPVELLKMLLSRHYQNTTLPDTLSDHLLETLCSKKLFSVWPLEEILVNRESFFKFLQEQWPRYLNSLGNGSTNCIVPFDHQDVRAYADTLFLEGLLKPVQVETTTSLPGWVQFGIQRDPQVDALKRLQKLLERCKKLIPAEDAPHRDWQKLARTWAELVVLRWELETTLATQEREAWDQLHGQIEDEFSVWMRNRFGSLHNLPFVPQPVMVHHVPRYLASMRAEHNWNKVALVVMDGMSLDQWLVLRRCVEEKQVDWRLEESSVFAWVPTLTSISRQSIFASKPPLYFSESLETTDREPKHWTQFWEDQGVSGGSVGYAKMVESANSETLDSCLGHPHVSIVGIVVNTVDKIMHGEQQGIAGMHDAIRLWSEDAISLVERLFAEDFEVFVTADHGNVAAKGMGVPRQGVLVEVGGKRARIYDNPHFRAEATSDCPDSIEWPSIGLPPDRHVLVPMGLHAFALQGKQVVSHGGVALEEAIVPFVRISKGDR